MIIYSLFTAFQRIKQKRNLGLGCTNLLWIMQRVFVQSLFHSLCLVFFLVHRTMSNCRTNTAVCDTSSQRKWSVINLSTQCFALILFLCLFRFAFAVFGDGSAVVPSWKTVLYCVFHLRWKKIAFVRLLLPPFLMVLSHRLCT